LPLAGATLAFHRTFLRRITDVDDAAVRESGADGECSQREAGERERLAGSQQISLRLTFFALLRHRFIPLRLHQTVADLEGALWKALLHRLKALKATISRRNLSRPPDK